MNKYITELIGTFFLVMGAALGGAIGASLALMIMVYAGGHISGAHYNPAVTLSVWMRGKIDMKDAVMYWIFQVAGAIIAAVIVAFIFDKEGDGSCIIAEDGGTKAIIAELLGTFALAYVVLNVATAKGTSGNSFYGLAIAGTVLAMATVLGQFSGGAFNPAVAIGLSIQKSLCWAQIWMYLVGAFGGGALAAIIFSLNNPDDK
ncbi:MAG: aquaporin [Ferruginibacter sp.]